MNARTTLIAMTAIALLGGCNRAATNNSAAATNMANTATANAAAPMAPAAPMAAPAAATTPADAAFLTANAWAPAGMCAQSLTFNSDGTAVSGDDEGNWALAGDTLTMTKEGEPETVMTVARSGNDLIMTRNGTPMTVSPCPAA